MSLQSNIDKYSGDALAMLRAAAPGQNDVPYQWVHSGVEDEQQAWKTTAVLFEQSYHMSDLYITGPDVLRLLQDTSVNSYRNFGPGRAKQYLAVGPDGHVVADSILIALEGGEVNVAGYEHSLNWLQFHAEKGGYDVEFVREPHSLGEPGSKRIYRYELEGPNAWKILEAAAGGPLEHIPFFRTGVLSIAGAEVTALNHTMGGVPGEEATGLELFGPIADREKVIGAIVAAGEAFGLRKGGFIAYGSTVVESGWMGSIVPAVYTSPELADYREWLSDTAVENRPLSIDGSFSPDSVEAYYSTPWELGYGHMVKFDHDFIGRQALERLAQDPPGYKVWLRWDDEDVARVRASAAAGGPQACKPLPAPQSTGADTVVLGEETVGLAIESGTTVNLDGYYSVGKLRADLAVDGTRVEIVWGDWDGGVANAFVPEHTQTRIRATVHRSSPVA